MQGVFRGMSMPKMPKGTPAEIEQGVLSQLSASVKTLQAKSPADVPAYQHIVLDACTSAAESVKGVTPAETAVLGKIMSALGAS
jgi:hypothetical protein